jgi:hypothetical protein
MKEQVELEVAGLKDRIEQLEAAYEDLTNAYVDGLIKRVEQVRSETLTRLDEVEEHFRVAETRVHSKVSEKISETLENARRKFDEDVAKALEEQRAKILNAVIDPSTGRTRHH